MTDFCETVTISTDNGPVRINASEYDPKKHKIHKDDKDELPSTDANTFVAPEQFEPAPSAPILGEAHPYANTPETLPMEGEERRAVLEPVPPSPAGTQAAYRVAKIGRKFFVVDGTGEKTKGVEGIEEAGYSDEEDANRAASEASNRTA